MNDRVFVPDAEEMLSFGKRLAKQAKAGDIIFLQGPLGAGKTTLVRGFLRALGVSGRVKSPTFNLVEAYELEALSVFHFDLYRLKKAEELVEIGLRDYLTEEAICLFEWPERAKGCLPKPSFICSIEIPDTNKGRWVILKLNSF